MSEKKTEYTTKLSLQSISNFQKVIEKYKSQLPSLVANIVDRLVEEGIKDNLKSTVKKETKIEGKKVIGGYKTTDVIDTFKEYGTGIIGASNPHLSEALKKNDWEYDMNNHGEKGWKYPKGDGTYGWTKGIPARKKFYQSCKRVEENFEKIANEEFEKILGGN